eukprot:SAG31_NODE_45567_length_258_cov_0.748428_1_plen_69_part_01
MPTHTLLEAHSSDVDCVTKFDLHPTATLRSSGPFTVVRNCIVVEDIFTAIAWLKWTLTATHSAVLSASL